MKITKNSKGEKQLTLTAAEYETLAKRYKFIREAQVVPPASPAPAAAPAAAPAPAAPTATEPTANGPQSDPQTAQFLQQVDEIYKSTFGKPEGLPQAAKDQLSQSVQTDGNEPGAEPENQIPVEDQIDPEIDPSGTIPEGGEQPAPEGEFEAPNNGFDGTPADPVGEGLEPTGPEAAPAPAPAPASPLAPTAKLDQSYSVYRAGTKFANGVDFDQLKNALQKGDKKKKR
jgi:hypothetical protein